VASMRTVDWANAGVANVNKRNAIWAAVIDTKIPAFVSRRQDWYYPP